MQCYNTSSLIMALSRWLLTGGQLGGLRQPAADGYPETGRDWY